MQVKTTLANLRGRDEEGPQSTYDGAQDMERDEFRPILETAPLSSFRTQAFDSHYGLYRRREFLYQGTWRHFCRTDFMDDVCTFGLEQQINEDPEALRQSALLYLNNSYGVRIGPKRIAFIDAWSDG